MVIPMSYVKVKLTEKALNIYKNKNGFWKSNIDDDGYSTFSYDYFELLFYPHPLKEIVIGEIINFNK